MLCRLHYIAGFSDVATIRVDATQLSRTLYQSYGFAECDYVADRYCPGLDWYDMAMELDSGTRLQIAISLEASGQPPIDGGP